MKKRNQKRDIKKYARKVVERKLAENKSGKAKSRKKSTRKKSRKVSEKKSPKKVNEAMNQDTLLGLVMMAMGGGYMDIEYLVNRIGDLKDEDIIKDEDELKEYLEETGMSEEGMDVNSYIWAAAELASNWIAEQMAEKHGGDEWDYKDEMSTFINAMDSHIYWEGDEEMRGDFEEFVDAVGFY